MEYQVYFPHVLKSSPLRDCFGDDSALAFYQLLMADERQQRPSLGCHPGLIQAAQRRAYGLANGDPWGHVDRNGVTANEYVRATGVVLPAEYAERGNNVESIAAGSPDATAIFTALARSESHSQHLFGVGDFLNRQRHCGIAIASGGPYGFYWVIMIAETR
jgi:uncharacterized protein YkwD